MTNFDTQTVLTSEFGSLNPEWLTSREAYRYIFDGSFQKNLIIGSVIPKECWVNPIVDVYINGAKKTHDVNPYNFLYKLRDQQLIECQKYDGRIFFNKKSIDKLAYLIEIYAILAGAVAEKAKARDLCEMAQELTEQNPQVFDSLFHRQKFGKLETMGQELNPECFWSLDPNQAYKVKFQIEFWSEIKNDLAVRDALGLGEYEAA